MPEKDKIYAPDLAEQAAREAEIVRNQGFGLKPGPNIVGYAQPGAINVGNAGTTGSVPVQTQELPAEETKTPSMEDQAAREAETLTDQPSAQPAETTVATPAPPAPAATSTTPVAPAVQAGSDDSNLKEGEQIAFDDEPVTEPRIMPQQQSMAAETTSTATTEASAPAGTTVKTPAQAAESGNGGDEAPMSIERAKKIMGDPLPKIENKIKAGYDPNATAHDPLRESIEEAHRTNIQSIADYAQGIRDDYEAQRKEDIALMKADAKAAKWTGATELAASIANLIAVGGHGASNQVYKTRSQDWMAKAEAQMDKSRERLQRARERQRAVDLEKVKAETNAKVTLAEYDIKKQQRDAENKIAMIKAKIAADEAAWKRQVDAGKMSRDEYNAQVNAAKAASQMEVDAARAAYYKSKTNGGGSTKSGTKTTTKAATPENDPLLKKTQQWNEQHKNDPIDEE